MLDINEGLCSKASIGAEIPVPGKYSADQHCECDCDRDEEEKAAHTAALIRQARRLHPEVWLVSGAPNSSRARARPRDDLQSFSARPARRPIRASGDRLQPKLNVHPKI